MKLNSFSLSEVGKVRKANEDAFSNADTPNGKVYVVCDGMGGHVGGAAASNLAAKSIIEYFEKEQYENIFNAIDRAFQFANEQIFAYAQAEPSLQGMGTTAVVLIIKGEDCFIGHVGDSRCYLKTDSKLHRLTKDHSYVQGLVDSGVITDEEAESHPKKNQILKALGHSLEVQGTICPSPIKVKSGDVFLLCSDGLNGMISDKIISDAIDFNDLNESGARLYEAAMDNRGADNITVVLVGVLESSHSGKSIFISYNPDNRLTTSQFDNKPDNFLTTKDFKKKKNTKLQALIMTLAVFVLFVGGFAGYNYYQEKGKEPQGSQGDIASITEQDIKNKKFEELDNLKGQKTNIQNGTIVIVSDKNGGTMKVKVFVSNEKIDSITKAKDFFAAKEEKESKEQGNQADTKPNAGDRVNNNGDLSIKLPKTMNIDEIKKYIKQKIKNPSATFVSDNELMSMNQAAVDQLKQKDKDNVKEGKVYPQGFKFKYKLL
jgi:serine/threonine protein phosphatase PrpC